MVTILEVAQKIDRRFLEIDNLFKETKLQTKIGQVNSSLIKIEKKLQAIFNIDIRLQADYIGTEVNNVVCIPIFKKNQSFTKKLSLDNIDSINIILGYNIISMNTPSELTAIILHEIGHISNSLEGFQLWINQTLLRLDPISSLLTLIPIIGGIFFLLRLGGFKLTSRIKEYKADTYAVKHGYGDELMSALNKINKINIKHNKETTIFKKIVSSIENFLTSMHPKEEFRIQQIYNNIIDEYADNYDSKKINKIVKKYKIVK